MTRSSVSKLSSSEGHSRSFCKLQRYLVSFVSSFGIAGAFVAFDVFAACCFIAPLLAGTVHACIESRVCLKKKAVDDVQQRRCAGIPVAHLQFSCLAFLPSLPSPCLLRLCLPDLTSVQWRSVEWIGVSGRTPHDVASESIPGLWRAHSNYCSRLFRAISILQPYKQQCRLAHADAVLGRSVGISSPEIIYKLRRFASGSGFNVEEELKQV